MAHYYNPITGKVETVSTAKKNAVDEYYGQKNKLNLARNPFFIVGIALAVGIGIFGFKLKELFTLLKVEASAAADTIIETVTDPFQIEGHSEKQKFLSDWGACRLKYPEGTWFRASRVSACMLGKGWASEIIGEGLEAALKKL